MKDMGIAGYLRFLAKKMLTVYNDGTYAWGGEGNFFMVVFQQPDNHIRNIYYADHKYYDIYVTVMQSIWVFVLGAAAVSGLGKENRQEIIVLMLSIVGLTLFEVLFEARARYLYTYAPVFCILAAIGIERLYMIIHCYNEEKVLPITSEMFLEELNLLITKDKISENSRILFVNDGSKDKTWDLIKKLSEKDEHFIGICQSRNRGHQNAVLAGMLEAKDVADITISIDCDGQDDIAAMEAMVDRYHEGCEIVYGVRSNRDTDTFFKRFTAQTFYKLLNKLGGEIVYNHADYRLVSARVLKEFANFKEVNLFLRGMIPLVGFKSTSVYYERHERLAGESHYPLSKMLALAFDGITSLSVKPIRLITGFGLGVSALSFIGIIWAVIATILGKTVAGWSSTVCIVCFMGGIQLICLGVLGEYIGKIYMEVKARPRYIISERTWEKDEKEEQKKCSK